MYLKSIAAHGFKSFAEKVTLEFLPPEIQSGRLPIIGIVGPNGSGKSNVADAVRWVLGEQSIKAVRGKKSEDIIFAGSARRSRASFAQVVLTVINDDKRIPFDAEVVEVARRLYRDGQSEYLLNNKVVRLMDIQMLLARAAFGKEGYSVIGQGQIDAILTASLEERKIFFDEATGVRPLQIKKEQSLKKLAATEENLWQAQALRDEITPRLKSLVRQVRRLEQREALQSELHELERQYYGTLLYQNETEYKRAYDAIVKIQENLEPKLRELKALEKDMLALEKTETKPAELLKIQGTYEELIGRKQKLRDREFEFKRKLLEIKKDASAIPLSEIVAILEGIKNELEGLRASQDLKIVVTLFTTVSELLGRLKGESTPKQASTINDELAALTQELKNVDQELERLRVDLQRIGEAAEEKKQSFFEMQRKLTVKQSEVHALEAELSNLKIELAKVETRRDALDQETKQELGDRYAMVRAALTESHANPAQLLPEIQKLKRQLETIGGIDEETIKEYKEVSARHEFLENQIADLEQSLNSLVALLEELELTIKTQFEDSFAQINTEFGNYFRILFGGGQAKLSKIIEHRAESEEQRVLDPEQEALSSKPLALSHPSSLLDKFTKKDAYRGVEISATPPGKKLKSITMLSGGERALTSIALLGAILALNPPPFVILDEVDAALDESNSARFAAILTELAPRTQFIVITHNRATMQAAEVLYGVTMGDDGVSKILSLKFEQAEEAVASR
ncbi:AAA family ATPase [Candidatus Uhrbacteria bacterium]|nr:AAA family ATPase [Candidatus Uhrbacteria bacterium]